MSNKLSEGKLSEAFQELISDVKWPVTVPQQLQVSREFASQQGRPDFVAFKTSRSFISKATKERVGSVLATRSCALMMALLKPSAPRTTTYLRKMSGMSGVRLRWSISCLEKQGLIERTKNGSFVASATWIDPSWEFWAFEVKVDDWKRALYQALQYRAFAHRSIVVIAEQWAHRIERNLDRFKSFGIGVIAVDADKKAIRVIRHPTRAKPYSRAHYYYAIGKFLASDIDATEFVFGGRNGSTFAEKR